MTSANPISFIFDILGYIPEFHARTNPNYKFLNSMLINAVESKFGRDTVCKEDITGIGTIDFPYFEMGSINSTHLFGLDELIIFAYYKHNLGKYKNVADMGANIGLHSIMLSRLGYNVSSYEPDPIHLKQLKLNLNNNCKSNIPIVHEKAISIENGTTQFTRVVGNTTGSHIYGAKQNPYGQLETFDVKTRAFREVMKENDLLKIDVEGHEAAILCTTDSNDWENTDAIVEVGTTENAKQIYQHFKDIGVNLFSQSRGWERVKEEHHIPASYKDGSLFISRKAEMPWK